jgi:hypothetical protein
VREILSIVLLGLSVVAAGSGTATIKEIPGERQPQLTIDGSGGIHLIFGADGKVFYTCSTDAGATYRAPIVVAELRSLALGMRRGPRIAVAGDFISITAIGSVDGESGNGNLYSWRSKDHGISWVGPVRVNDVNGSAREGLHGMTGGPNGELFTTWLDLRQHGTEIFGSRSTDGGATWSKNVLIYQSPDGTVCECCHPSVAIDSNGHIFVMWRNFLAGNRDMFRTSSRDHGKTFAAAEKLGKGTWPLKACPMDGGALAASPTGDIAAIWRRDRDVFLKVGRTTSERRLGAGMQPWLAADQQRLFAVWLSGRSGKLFFAESPEYRPIELDEEARLPTVAAGPSRKGLAVVAWESGGNARSFIKIARIDPQ